MDDLLEKVMIILGRTFMDMICDEDEDYSDNAMKCFILLYFLIIKKNI